MNKMKEKKVRTMANPNLDLKEYVHALLSKEDLGNMEPHARCGRPLSWPQQVQGILVVAPGMQVKEDKEHLAMCERKKQNEWTSLQSSTDGWM